MDDTSRKMTRDEIPARVSRHLDHRPVHWTRPEWLLGDYEGRSRTLDVFNADPAEQIPLLRRLRPLRPELEEAAGGPVTIIFHTCQETRRLYPDVVSAGASVRQLHDQPMRFQDVEVPIGEVASPRIAA